VTGDHVLPRENDYVVVKVEFVPAIRLYRRACAMAEQAENRAAQHKESGVTERRLREMDAVMETIILTQAAAEGWIHHAYREAEVQAPLRTNWRARWAIAPALIVGEGVRSLEPETVESLEWLSAWRNYLAHDDDQARARIANFVPPGTEAEQLTATLARQVIDRMDRAFGDIGSIIGFKVGAAPNSAALWVASDEK
jgi:hypothetical protein